MGFNILRHTVWGFEDGQLRQLLQKQLIQRMKGVEWAKFVVQTSKISK
jgi:hypothetical protein